MENTSFRLESLLEIHDLPFRVLNAQLQVVAINQAWQQLFDTDRVTYVGSHCCADAGPCRHRSLFQTLEPYLGLYPFTLHSGEIKWANVRGVPILDNQGRVYLAESLSLLSRPATHASGGMIGQSPVFQALQTRLQQAARLDAAVLLNGQTGTGKELAAEFIHQHSLRAGRELVVADCTVLNEELFESELFGHEKGAFTGAAHSKKGLFELADGGTLFLDEIGELPLSQQAKLLRALEKGQFRRVGGTVTLSADVRVIAASHRDLAKMVQQGSFREDLFYRLSVFPIEIPSLHQRSADIPLLARHFLQQLSVKHGQVFGLHASAQAKLMQHNWPGNIRELKNCLQLACGLCQNAEVRADDIQFMRVATEAGPVMQDVAIHGHVGGNPLEQYEANFIRELMSKYRGNRRLIAAEMNISERTLYRKLNRLNLS